MKNGFISKRGGTALLAVFLLSCGIALAQSDKEKEKKKITPPSKSTAGKAEKGGAEKPAAVPEKVGSKIPGVNHLPGLGHKEPAPERAPANVSAPRNVTPGGERNVNRPPSNPIGRGAGSPPAGRPAPRPEFHGANGSSVHYGAAGRPTVVRTQNATVYHAPGGARTAVVTRPGGRVVVTNARGHGYVQRPVTVRGRTIVERTYVVRGRPYARYYRPVTYGGVAFAVYTPVRFYTPRFYVWAVTPWASPVYFSFGWGPATPWYGYYGGYFAPYPAYAGPNYWLTDYLIANSLDASYQERLDAANGAVAAYDPGGQVALTPQVKDMIAQEVRSQLAQENMDSQTQNVAPSDDAAPPVLDGASHVFVAYNNLVVNAGGQDCSLTGGDVVQVQPGSSQDPSYANARVLASKGQDCPTGEVVAIQLTDLQEMQNHMREALDQGLGDLQAKQGQNNLPAIDPALRAQTPAPYAAELPPPEPSAESELQQNAREITAQDDALVQQAGAGAPPADNNAGGNPPAGTDPPTVAEGQTIDEVISLMGQPLRKAKVGDKDIYIYKDMKITFVAGKVTDIQ
ncbi:MAG TPA: hypothetical protein VKU19_04760 [Bryobacteraceae bacterium]|nr:hypothetical protein [Bryobacteraceae bacterium]